MRFSKRHFEQALSSSNKRISSRLEYIFGVKNMPLCAKQVLHLHDPKGRKAFKLMTDSALDHFNVYYTINKKQTLDLIH